MFKRIGRELLEHPKIEDVLIQPFKSQGVLNVDDCGLIIRAKFMSKPVRQFTIRHRAYRAIQEAFAAVGIGLATPDVRVNGEDVLRHKAFAGRAKSAAAAPITTPPEPTAQA